MNEESEWWLEDQEERPRDIKIDDAVDVLRALFRERADKVFYGRQLEVILEKQFFHWITKKAVGELAKSGEIEAAVVVTDRYELHFYWSKKLRYARRQIIATTALVAEFSDPNFTKALGAHGEIMAEIAFGRRGFQAHAKDVRTWSGRRWTDSNKNLDRVVGRDNVFYGCEVKNALGYIERDELEMKIEICRHLQLVPLFITRQMPASYMVKVQDAGGFCLVLGYQIYPLGFNDLSRRVRETLGLPVDCRSEWQEQTLDRFVGWHERKLVV